MIRAAQYIRMSTDHQRYSPRHQAAAIAQYAKERGYEVVVTYPDLGISGLGLKARRGLQGLIADIAGGAVPYSTVLVYDVSRWGRFQDVDQSAHYEFLCREAGVNVEYCAEQFDNDGSIASTILKLLKRVMAAEFSRDLSTKVLHAQLRLAAQGLKMGGQPGYGLRRVLIDKDGEAIAVLEQGERNYLRSNRVILMPGPSEEIAVVRRIYQLFLTANLWRTEIARRLNKEGVPFVNGAAWSLNAVHRVLTEEKYAGVYVFNRTSDRLGRTTKHNPPEEWVRAEGALLPLVDRKTFDAVAQRVGAHQRHSDDILISKLRKLLARHGRLTNKMINAAKGVPSDSTYRKRFGSTDRAFELAGFVRLPNQRRRVSTVFLLDWLRRILAANGRLSASIIDASAGAPSSSTIRNHFGSLLKAYKAIGYQPDRLTAALSDRQMIARLRVLHRKHGKITRTLMEAEPGVPLPEAYERRFGSIGRVYELAGFQKPNGVGVLKAHPPDFKPPRRRRKRPKRR